MIEQIIDEIEQVRQRNNRNWMDILRLAFRNSPDEAGQIMARIRECDMKISELTAKLARTQTGI